jgi:hypothetical protein
MHNHQYLKTNNISKLAVIALSIVLITGIFLLPAIHLRVYGQQPPQQQNQILPIQVIKQIAKQVATASPGTDATNVYQILVQLAKITTQTASQEKALEDIRQISTQVTKYPFSTVSQSLAHFAQQLSASSDGGNGRSSTNAIQVAQQITQEKSNTGQNISESIVTKAIQIATGANPSNVKQLIRHAAQVLSNRASVPVEKVEAVVIQIALQISQEQGKAVTAQSISQIVNQIAQNPNGVIAQAILKIVKQYTDDNGKTGKMVNIIDNIIKSGGENNKSILKMIGDRGKEGGRDGQLQTDDCKKIPKLAGCQTTEPIPNSGLEPDDNDNGGGGISKASREDKEDDNDNGGGGISKASREDKDDGRDASTTFNFDQNQKNRCSGFASCSNTGTLIFTLGAQSHPD